MASEMTVIVILDSCTKKKKRKLHILIEICCLMYAVSHGYLATCFHVEGFTEVWTRNRPACAWLKVSVFRHVRCCECSAEYSTNLATNSETFNVTMTYRK
jgi:hypothetical protein